MSGSVYLNIDRIVLDGFDHIDRRGLTIALQQALEEQLASTDLSHSSATPLSRTHITLQQSSSATQLGQSLARELCSVVRNSGAAASVHHGSEHGAEADA